jgi:CRISPR-associated protein Cmr6
MRPLYRSAEQVVLGCHGHRGLWFDKFCDQWRKDDGGWTMKTAKPEGSRGEPLNPKLEWLRKVLQETSPVGEKHQLEAATKRLVRLAGSVGGDFVVFRTESRFVTGLGRAHPLENGFAWHPTLGTPFLPGSSVKGLVRSWAEAEAEPSLRERLLGKGGSEGHAGAVCFLDALPVGPVRLEVDVLTPHYASWTTVDPPGDWRSPVPVPFLVTSTGQSFVFAVVPCRGQTSEDVEIVLAWLRQALSWEGAGAKTAVGYGRFVEDREAGAKLQEAHEAEARARARKAAMGSPEGRWRVQVEEWSERELYDQILTHLEKVPLSDPTERTAFVTAVRALREPWLALWRKKQSHGKTGVGGDKLKQRAKLIDGEPR